MRISAQVKDYTLHMDTDKCQVLNFAGCSPRFFYDGYIEFKGQKDTDVISKDITGQMFLDKKIVGVELFMRKSHTDGCECSFLFNEVW